MRIAFRILTAAAVVIAAVPVLAARGPYSAGVNGVSYPKVIAETRVAPEVPEGAAGTVDLEIVVRADGSVDGVRVLRCDRQGAGIENAVTRAVGQWRFEPGAWNGRPVDTVQTLRLHVGDVPATAAAAGIPVASTRPTGRDAIPALFRIPGLPGNQGGPAINPADAELTHRPTAAPLPSCAVGQTGCLYEKQNPNVAGKLAALPEVPVEPPPVGRR